LRRDVIFVTECVVVVSPTIVVVARRLRNEVREDVRSHASSAGGAVCVAFCGYGYQLPV
jgi:hypothetical protein